LGQTGTAAEVVAVEHSFAARVRAAGVKAGFLEYLAPDGVVFRPGPVNGREAYTDAPTSPVQLSWEPAVADISAAGDLGYSTGPFQVRARADAPVAGAGWYLSVWERQSDGTLRLLVDHGIAATTAPDTAVTVRLWPASPAGEQAAPDLAALDRASSAAPVHDATRTYAAGGLHIGASERAALFRDWAPALSPLSAGVASSNDLGYTYGSYVWQQEHGYYLRVWRLVGQRWVVIADVISPSS